METQTTTTKKKRERDRPIERELYSTRNTATGPDGSPCPYRAAGRLQTESHGGRGT